MIKRVRAKALHPLWAIPLVLAVLAAHAQTPPPPPPAAGEPHFAVKGFNVDGAHALSTEKIDQVLAPYVGPNESFAVLEEAVAALKEAYLKAGFSSVAIVLPEQEVDSGVIRIHVTEARLGRVTVSNNKFFDTPNILHALPGLVPGEMPNMDDVAAQARMSNDNPAKQIQITLRQGNAADETDAVVRVADVDPLAFAVVADNTGTDSSGRYRLGFAVHEANVFDSDHVFSAQVQTSPDRIDKVFIIGANYLIPLYAWRETLDFSVGYSNVNSGLVTTTAGSYGITGGGTTFSARLTQYLSRSETWNQRVFEGLEWDAYQNDVTAAGQGQSLVPNATVHPFNLGYALSFTATDVEADGTLSYSHNIPGGANGTSADFREPGGRANANASYQLLHYQGTLTAALPYKWHVMTTLEGQYTPDALVAPVQFGVGGVDSVRGFNERAITDDRGLRASVQLESPDEGQAWLGPNWQLHGVTFYDAATLSRNDPLPGELSHLFISSKGLGVRLARTNEASLRLDLAQVIDGADVRPKHSMMLHASAIYTF